MNIGGGGKNKKREVKEAKVQSWKDKKEVADKEEDDLRKDIENLKTWVDMIQSMNNQQVKEYLQNRPDDLKKIKTCQKSHKNKTKIQCAGKSKSSAYSGILASVWKFHKD
ncbi:hypothetical protein K1719_004469 [Acacia pycnantha]|nr:hypothetical protein K1719_004469 [Acacia pycnantha]